MPVPAIVHWDEYHWIVMTGVTRRHVSVVDPAAGRRRFTRAEFEKKWTGYAALFDYTPEFENAPESTRLMGWMWPLVRPHRSLLFQALGLAVVVSVLQMVLPVFTQIVVDRVLVEQDLSLLHLMIVAMGVTMVFIVASLLLQRYLISFSAVRIDAASLDFLTRRLLALPMLYFASRRTGDLQRRLEGIRQVRDFLVQNGIAGLTAIAQLVATVALMAVYSPWLTLVFLATAPLYALLMVMASKLLRPIFLDLEDSFSKYHSYQIDAIKGIETVKALGGESAFRRLLLNQFLGVADKIFRADFTVMTYEGGDRGRHLPRRRPVPVGRRLPGPRRHSCRLAASSPSTRSSRSPRSRSATCWCCGTTSSAARCCSTGWTMCSSTSRSRATTDRCCGRSRR